jgi:hypothetical protein
VGNDGSPGTGGTTVADGGVPATISVFVASPTTITAGKSATLSWTVSGATTVSIDGIGLVPGNSWVVTPSQTTTYTLTALNATGIPTSAQATVTVVQPAAISSFTADVSTLAPGGITNLTATFSNGTGTINDIANGTRPVTSGIGITSGVLVASTTFTLTVTNSAGDPTTATLTVSVAGVGFAHIGTMSAGRSEHTATLLANGKVLLAGGRDNSSSSYSSTADLYDPSSGPMGSLTAIGPMTAARVRYAATLLSGGKVLLSGGYNSAGGYLPSAELFDPASGANGTFATTGALPSARIWHTSTLLSSSGKVLVAGGYYGSPQASAVFNPALGATGTFGTTGPMITQRYGHTATPLTNGMVLIAGGNDGNNIVKGAELFDPSGGTDGTFAATGSMNAARMWHTATLLTSGKVLIAGGTYNGSSVNSAEVYDPSTGIFTITDSTMTVARSAHTATLLSNGRVLLAAGVNPATGPSSAELYDPTAGTTGHGTFSATAPMNAKRSNHTATMLGNGRVLVAGGSDGLTSLPSVELYVY